MIFTNENDKGIITLSQASCEKGILDRVPRSYAYLLGKWLEAQLLSLPSKKLNLGSLLW